MSWRNIPNELWVGERMRIYAEDEERKVGRSTKENKKKREGTVSLGYQKVEEEGVFLEEFGLLVQLKLSLPHQ